MQPHIFPQTVLILAIRVSESPIRSGVARALPAGPEGQNEDKNKESLRKNKKIMEI